MFKTDLKKERFSLVLFLIGLLYLFYHLMLPFLMPMILACILVVLFYPAFEAFERRLNGRRRTASFLTTLAIFLIILLPAILVITLVIDQSYFLVRHLNLKEVFSELFQSEFYQTNIVPMVQNFEERFDFQMDFLGLLTQVGRKTASLVSQYSPRVFFGTANFFFDFFIMMVGIYFLLLEGKRLLKLFYDISPMRDTHERRLLREFKNTIHASVYGYLVTALVQAVLAAFAFYISGLEGSAVLGTMTFFMSMVPVIGAAGVWIPVCVWLFLQGEVGWGIFNVIWGAVVISGIDNIIKPLIIQGKTSIHPLLIFFSLFGGIALFGPLGILFGPVTTATLIATLRIYRDEFV